jgi:hypothetical protein
MRLMRPLGWRTFDSSIINNNSKHSGHEKTTAYPFGMVPGGDNSPYGHIPCLYSCHDVSNHLLTGEFQPYHF